MRKYSQKLLGKFKETYLRKLGRGITDDEASQKLSTLADLVRFMSAKSDIESHNSNTSEEKTLCQE